MSAPLISPADLYPAGGQKPAYRLIDVRAPIEVARGALPGATCLPLMTDSERHEVGIRYKAAGQQAAMDLGFGLVGPDLPRRVDAWREVCEDGPTAVACWRGGLRSKLTCEFIDLPGVTRVDGGYKAIRRYLIEQMTVHMPAMKTIVIAGLTGTGKTRLLNDLGETRKDVLALDLEEAARHRGSAFGGRGVEQPAQATFENELALELTLTRADVLLLEDESRNIGRRQLPDPLFEAIRTGPMLLVEEPLERRIEQIRWDYVCELGETMGVENARRYLEASLLKLKKRLSNADLEACLSALEQAGASGAWRDSEQHDVWIRILLERYYDPLYRKSLRNSKRPTLFAGSREECYQWMKETPQPFA